MLTPKQLVTHWVEAFNRADVEALAALYAPAAVNHQVAETPVEGQPAIRAMFEREFARAEMVCLVENLFDDGEWAILEWRDPLGLRGCGEVSAAMYPLGRFFAPSACAAKLSVVSPVASSA